jgi:hypothetical protein
MLFIISARGEGISVSLTRRRSFVSCPGQRQMLIRICRRSLRKFPAENFLVRFCPFDSLFTSV